jgi:hypothetical protein
MWMMVMAARLMGMRVRMMVMIARFVRMIVWMMMLFVDSVGIGSGAGRALGRT